MSLNSRRVGIAVVGLGGAVATTAVAGLERLRLGAAGPETFLAPPAARDVLQGAPADGMNRPSRANVER